MKRNKASLGNVNNLAQLEAGVGKQTARQQEIQGNAAQKLFGLKRPVPFTDQQ